MSKGLRSRGAPSARALPDERGARRLLALRDGRLSLVAGARDAVVLVEPLPRRLAARGLVAAEVPLAEQRRRIADRLQRFGEGHLPQRHAAGLRGAAADRVASGHQRRARHRARELDVEVGEPQALGWPAGRCAASARRGRCRRRRPRPSRGCRERSGRRWAARAAPWRRPRTRQRRRAPPRPEPVAPPPALASSSPRRLRPRGRAGGIIRPDDAARRPRRPILA